MHLLRGIDLPIPPIARVPIPNPHPLRRVLNIIHQISQLCLRRPELGRLGEDEDELVAHGGPGEEVEEGVVGC